MKCIMHKKKKRILIWLTLFLIQISVVKLSNGKDLNEKDNKVVSGTVSEVRGQQNEENIFVFPSMQMEGIAAASSRGGKHVPVVEVIYRGQPPSPEDKITSTTMSSSEVISSTPRGKCFVFFKSY